MATPTAPGTKAARQARIAAILAREQVHSQEQLAGLLSQYTGLHVTQATLSRDLDELGVVRLRAVDGTLVYALPADPGGHGSLAGTSLAGPGTSFPERTGPAASPSASGQASTSGQAPGDGPAAGRAATDKARGVADGAANRDAGGTAPSSAAASGASPRLVRYLKELLTSAEASANLVVLRTPAGAAQFLASAIDHTAWPAILGTVAGDDTVIVIARDPAGGEALAEDFRRLAERRR